MSDPVALVAGRLQLAFTWHGDRFGHQIALLGPGGPVLLVESLEGDDQDPWPTSPPLQELHIEDRPHGVQVALLVGRAGKSHWSLSCEVDPAAGRLTFEAACRLRTAPERLGSAYQLGAQVAAVAGDQLLTDAGPCSVGSSTPIDQSLGGLRFTADAGDSPLPRTVVWSYRFEASLGS